MPRELPYVTCKKTRKIEPSLAKAENENANGGKGPAIIGTVPKPPKSKQTHVKQHSKAIILPKHLNFQGGQLRDPLLRTRPNPHLSQGNPRVTKDAALVQ